MEDVEKAVGKAIVDLIDVLDKIGIISKIKLIEQLGSEDIVIIRESRRYNYSKVAEFLKDHPVFIPIDRKRAVYAQRRLREILGKDVYKKRTKFGYVDGYLFFT